MIPKFRSLSLALTFVSLTSVALFGAGCGGCSELLGVEPEPVPIVVDGNCRRSIDCNAGAICDQNSGSCVQVICSDDVACNDPSTRCDVVFGICIDAVDACGMFGSTCTEGERCVLTGTQRNCIAIDDDSERIERCSLSPQTLVVRHGLAINLDLRAFTADGARVDASTFTLTTSDDTVLNLENTGILAVCAGESACSATVVARSLSGIECASTVTVFPEVADDTFEVIAFAPETMTALSATSVSAQVGDVVTTVDTDEDGRAIFALDGGTISHAGVFAEGRRWQSVIQPTGDEVFLLPSLEVAPDDRVSGQIDGAIIRTEPQERVLDVGVSIAGVGSFSPLKDWTANGLDGLKIVRNVDLEGFLTGPQIMSSAIQLRLADVDIHAHSVVPIADDRRRHVWSLRGELRLADLGPALADTGVEATSHLIGHALSKHGYSSQTVVRATFTDDVDGIGVPPGAPGSLTADNAIIAETPRTQRFRLSFPALPCQDGFDVDRTDDVFSCDSSQFVDKLLAIIMSRQSSGEWLVVGLSSAQDRRDRDDRPDGIISQANESALNLAGQSTFSFATGHDGFETGDVVALFIADDGLVGDAGSHGDIVIVPLDVVVGGDASETLRVPPFLDPPSGRWNTTDRTYTPTSAAAMSRLRFEGNGGGWDVYFEGDDAVDIKPFIESRALPSTFDARTEFVFTDTFQLQANVDDMGEVFRLGGDNVSDLTSVVNAESSRRCVPPFGQNPSRRCLME